MMTNNLYKFPCNLPTNYSSWESELPFVDFIGEFKMPFFLLTTNILQYRKTLIILMYDKLSNVLVKLLLR